MPRVNGTGIFLATLLGTIVLLLALLIAAVIADAQERAPVESCEIRLLTTERDLLEARAAVAQLQLRLLDVAYGSKTRELEAAKAATKKETNP